MKRSLTLVLTLLVSACSLTNTELRTMAAEGAELAEEWLTNNVREKGLFVYRYNPSTDSAPSSQNELRQLMGSRMLAILAARDPRLLGLHRKNMNFILQHWYREDDIGYIYFSDKSKLGGNAMLLRTFVQSPDFGRYENAAKKVADGILSLQNPDGSFQAWLYPPDYEYDEEYLLTFYSGEAILALLEYAIVTGQDAYIVAAKRSQDFYIEEYISRMEENYYPAYVPWHVMALRILYEETKEKKYADAVFTLTDKVLELLDTERYIGRFYHPATPEYGSPHSSSDGVYTEGLAHAYYLARVQGDTERTARYRDALNIAVQNLRTLQYSSNEASQFPQPQKVQGGVRTSISDEQIRVDTVQHAWDAFQAVLVFTPR